MSLYFLEKYDHFLNDLKVNKFSKHFTEKLPSKVVSRTTLSTYQTEVLLDFIEKDFSSNTGERKQRTKCFGQK